MKTLKLNALIGVPDHTSREEFVEAFMDWLANRNMDLFTVNSDLEDPSTRPNQRQAPLSPGTSFRRR